MTLFTDTFAAIRRICQVPEGFLPLHAPLFCGQEKAYVCDTIDSTFVSSVGAYVERFEDMLCHSTGAKHAVACANGTAALQVALHVAGVEREDLVLTQSLSFAATANAIAHCGAEPVFLDVDTDTLGLSPQAVEHFLQTHCERRPHGVYHKATGKRVSACVPMHTFGLPMHIQELVRLCDSWGIPVVEDAAEALGSRCATKHCGTFGKLGVLSFNGNKIVTTGGGGAILTDDAALAKQAKHLTTTAKIPHRWRFEHDSLAWNFRMPNLNAALGCGQMEMLPTFLTIKRQRAQEYAAYIAQTPWAILRERAECQSNYWLCALVLRSREERDDFLEASNDAGIMTRPVWEPLHTLRHFAAALRDNVHNTLHMADRVVNIPSGVLRV